MNQVQSLRQSAVTDNVLRNRLLEQFSESLSDDEECLLDTLDGISSFVESVDAALCMMAEAESMAAATKARAQELMRRSHGAQSRADRIRKAILWAMLDTQRAKVICTEATVSIRLGGKAVEITDLSLLPPDMLRTVEPDPDKRAIKEALSSGREIAGATLVDSPATIQIRSI